jgi:hypothetical protein
MYKRTKCISIFVALCYSGCISSAYAKEIHVAMNGNDSLNTGSVEPPFRTIQQAAADPVSTLLRPTHNLMRLKAPASSA